MIEPKKKPCRGTGKARGHGCGKQTIHRVYGLGKMCGCYSHWLLNTDAGKLKLERATLKATKPRRELESAELDSKARTSLSALKKQTQLLFNRYIRMRDEGRPCISSNVPYRKDFDAGHCFPVGSYEGLRYDFDNVHGQSIGDNRFKEGNHLDYLTNLPSRIGEHRTRLLIIKAETYKRDGHRFTRSELLGIQKDVKRRMRELKNKQVV